MKKDKKKTTNKLSKKSYVSRRYNKDINNNIIVVGVRNMLCKDINEAQRFADRYLKTKDNKETSIVLRTFDLTTYEKSLLLAIVFLASMKGTLTKSDSGLDKGIYALFDLYELAKLIYGDGGGYFKELIRKALTNLRKRSDIIKIYNSVDKQYIKETSLITEIYYEKEKSSRSNTNKPHDNPKYKPNDKTTVLIRFSEEFVDIYNEDVKIRVFRSNAEEIEKFFRLSKIYQELIFYYVKQPDITEPLIDALKKIYKDTKVNVYKNKKYILQTYGEDTDEGRELRETLMKFGLVINVEEETITHRVAKIIDNDTKEVVNNVLFLK